MSDQRKQRDRTTRSLAVVSLTGAAFLLILCSCPGTHLSDIAGELFDRPMIESITPTSGPEAGGTKITIAGLNFDSNAAILFGTVSGESVNCVNRGLIEVVSPAHAPGMVDITVVNGAGQKFVVRDAFEFEAFDPPPTQPLNLLEVMPSQGPAGMHTPVTLFGTNFVDDCTVMFGAFLCDEVEMVDKTMLRVMAPPQPPGFVDIIVRRPNGDVSILPDAFEYRPAASGDLPGPPRLVSAVSTSNTSVRVTFSEPVAEGANDASNYSIVQTNVNPEAGALRVLQAQLAENPSVVTLTTMSQNEVVYTLTVTHVRDLAGNELAPPGIMVNPAQTEFAGTPPVRDDIVDSDGDGLPDHAEQRGWIVRILLANGDVEERGVTSDPTSSDTDRDGIGDQEECRRGMDPRRADTDADELSDFDEVRTWYSNPTSQDTDQDGLSDTADVYFKTSPILADTDGDGFGDWNELFEMNRNPRLADLPQPELTVGDMRLQIDERYSYVDHEGNTVTQASSSSATLSQSDSTKFSHSDTSTNESFIEAGVSMKFNPWPSEVTASVKGGHKWGSTSQTSRESAKSSQQAYQESLAKGRTYTTTHTVTREVHGASLDVGLTLGNTGDIAFTLSNVEVSVMQPGRTRTQFVPVATLLPSAELLTGEASVFNLYPLEERGPILFSNLEIFPNLVEDLMRAPRGLIFKVTNFDITDEFGRNLAFTTQDVFERTGTLTVDPGDGTFERYYVATSGGKDTHGYGSGGLVGGYDANGVAIGVPLDFILQDVLGLSKNPDRPNAIVAGEDGVAQTAAANDDIQAVPVGTEGLPDRTILVLAGEDGVLDTVPNNVSPGGDDRTAITTGYQTSATCDAETPARIIEPTVGGDAIASTVAQGDDVQEVPVRYCIGGISDGQFCARDEQCPSAVCQFNYVCVGGDNAGLPCGAFRDCNPYCDLEADPPVCMGGANNGTECTEDRECRPYCNLDAAEPTCEGGGLAGETCVSDSDCLEAGCDLVGACNGGDNDGEMCEVDRDCVPHCEESACVGGHNPGASCVSDSMCAAQCVNSVCVGGDNAGQTCSENRDCGPRCHQFLCAGGANDGMVCESNADCPGGDCPSDPPQPGQVIVSAGPDGLLQTVANGDDEYRGPGTICDSDAICRGQDCAPGEDCPPGTCTGREVLVRYDNSITGDPNRFWVILSSDEIPIGTDFGDFLLKPDEGITLAFGQDIDRDGLFAREEYLYGSSDRKKDTDADALGDYAEIRIGWGVTVYRPKTAPEHREVFPDPTLADSDFDGLDDYTEMRCGTDPRKRDTDGDGLSDMAELSVCSSDAVAPQLPSENCCDVETCVVAEPCVGDAIAPGEDESFETELEGDDTWFPDDENRDEIRPGENGILDSEKAATDVFLSSDCPENRPVCVSIVDEVCNDDYHAKYPPEYLDPRNADTDGDSLEDGLEISLAAQLAEEENQPNPLNPCDADMFRDTDMDGLTDQEERVGWEVTVKLCSNTCASAFDGTCDDNDGCVRGTDCADCGHRSQTERVYPSPTEGDSDFDGLPDYLESVLHTNPLEDDTDCDGILDYDEFDEFGTYMNLAEIYPGFYLSGAGSQQLGTDPASQDTDLDRLPDAFELYDGWRVLVPDEDVLREVTSDPRYFDTDLDGLSDLKEYLGADGLDPSVQKACDGGPNDGQPCNWNANCTDEGTCTSANRCAASHMCRHCDWGCWFRSPCDLNANDCPFGEDCAVVCSTMWPCPGSYPDCYNDDCVSSEPCVGDADCEDHAYCASVKVCRGGPNDGSLCEVEADCDVAYGCRPVTPDATDPRDPDTDGDGRLDGREREPGVNTDPLRKDLKVTVSYQFLAVNEIAIDGGVVGVCPPLPTPHGATADDDWNYGDYYFNFYVKRPNDSFPGRRAFTQCDWINEGNQREGFCRTTHFYAGEVEPLLKNETVEAVLTPGQSVSLFVEALEIDGCGIKVGEDDQGRPEYGPSVNCENVNEGGRLCVSEGELYRMNALRRVTFEELIGVHTYSIELSLTHLNTAIGNTDMTVHAEITVD